MLVTPYRIIKTLASVNLEKQKYNPTRGGREEERERERGGRRKLRREGKIKKIK